MTASAIIESEHVRNAFHRRAARMETLERRGELVVGGGFIAAALGLILVAGVHGSFSVSLAALYVLCVAGSVHVRFDIGAGFTLPTQLVFVPMLFALPPALVPALVAVALAIGTLPGILQGNVPSSRLLAVPGNSWFSWGPALVLAVTHDHRPDAHLGLLFAALAAQLVVDFAANAARERIRHGISLRHLADEMRWVYVIDLALSPVGLAAALAAEVHAWAPFLVAPLLGVLRLFSKERRARLEQLLELQDAYRGTALVLGDVVEADDRYTGEHSKSVVRLAIHVAERLGLDASRQRNVEFGALLHDVGKIAVPKEIINKPGKLDDNEWMIIKAHTIEGQRMLERVGGLMRDVGQIVRSSHEAWDGSGYPDGLAGEEIPLEARIISACDAFNAMTTTRTYRRAMPLPVAIAELVRHAGSQFDARVVDALIQTIDTGDTTIAAAA